ncbi:hypothetical protein KIH39_16440 [Telmatocola sphagniphila]|uniref:PEP-CTERM protein-sorting domain-containing protein n=1 Tax=Telmatocola sphagniphila TaxID=1123043 RepID=A0A8E6B342_9BACT|nr:hypothetical protein [Telmatocola sphagniphila]QVL30437.1 hypothetical protein KIH39_16440 [Telmatocola sphagniphila]
MRIRRRWLLAAVLAALYSNSDLKAQTTYYATGNGNWSTAGTWTPSGIPGVNDSVYIGSTGGGANSATVALLQAQYANDVTLGDGASASGILNLGAYTLTAGSLTIGNGGNGAITRTTGYLVLGTLNMNGSNTLVMNANDSVNSIALAAGASLTTASVNNITSANAPSSIYVSTGSTLTLGANLDLSANGGSIYLTDAGSVLNANGHTINTGQYGVLSIGDSGSGNPTLQNRGPIIGNLSVSNQTFNLISSDNLTGANGFTLTNGSSTLVAGSVVSSLTLYGSNATTTQTGNITGTVTVANGSTLTLGANLDLSANNGYSVNLQDSGSTLNANGHTINVGQFGVLNIGVNGSGNPTLLNRGPIIGSLSVANQDFTLTSSDQITGSSGFSLSNGTTTLGTGVVVSTLSLSNSAKATTTQTGNITGSITIATGSTLTLGANLDVSANSTGFGFVNLQDNASVLNANGYSITTGFFGGVNIGTSGSGMPTIQNRGPIIGNLSVSNQNITLTAADQITGANGLTLSNGSTTLGSGVVISSLTLNNSASATTTQTGNITGSVIITSGSTLTLGANLDLSAGTGQNVYLQDSGSVLNANGYTINTGTNGTLSIGVTGSGNPTLLNRGPIIGGLSVANQNITLTASDQLNGASGFSLSNGSTALVPGVVVSSLYLSNGATATTSQIGNITNGVSISTGSSLTLGADLNLTNLNAGSVNLTDSGSVLDCQFHTITTGPYGSVNIGLTGTGNPTILHRGPIIGSLSVANQSITLTTADQITGPYGLSLSGVAATTVLGTGIVISGLNLSNGATATTTQTGNIAGQVGVNITSGSTLNLGANLDLSAFNYANVNLQDAGSVLNANGYSIKTGYYQQFFIGTNGIGNPTLQSRGPILGNLSIANQSFTLSPADQLNGGYGLSLSGNLATTVLGTGVVVSGLSLTNGASATTTQAGNIAGQAGVSVASGSTLTLGANLDVSAFSYANINLQDAGSVINANGYTITTGYYQQVFVGVNGTGAPTLVNRGPIVGNLSINGIDLDLTTSDNLNGAYGFTVANGTTTLNPGIVVSNLTLNEGGIAVATAGTTNPVAGQFAISGGTLSLPSGSVFTSAATSTINLSTGSITGTGTLINNGTLNYTGGTITNITFTNNGTLTVTGSLDLSTVNITNYAANTLTGGIWQVNDNSTLSFGSNLITTIAANTTVILGGPNATFTAINGLSTNNGTLSLQGGRTFTAGLNFNNTGTVDVQNGTLDLSNSNIINFSGGTLTGGTWSVGDTNNSNGTINFGSKSITTLASSTTVILSGTGATFNAINNLATNNGNFQVINGKSFTTVGTFLNNGSLTVGTNSTLAVPGDLTNSATGTLINYGNINVGGTFSTSGNYQNYGTLSSNNPGYFNGGTVSTSGTITLGSTLTVNSSTNLLNGTVSVTGTTTVNSTLTVSGGANFTGSGNLIVTNSSQLSLPDPTSQVSKVVTIQSGGYVNGNGTISTLSVQSGGILKPGDSPGIITITNGLDLGGGAVIDVPPGNSNTQGNTKPGSGFDTITITTSNTIIRPGASMQIRTTQPNWGDSFWGVSESWRVITNSKGNFVDQNSIILTGSNAPFVYGMIDTNNNPISYSSYGTITTSIINNSDGSSTMDLIWQPTPVPEPVFLVGLAAILVPVLRRRRTPSHPAV